MRIGRRVSEALNIQEGWTRFFYLISCETNTLLVCTFENGGKNICQNRSKPKNSLFQQQKLMLVIQNCVMSNCLGKCLQSDL